MVTRTKGRSSSNGERQNYDRRKIGEDVGLDHQGGTWLAGIAPQGDGDQIAPLHGQSGSSFHASAASASQKAISSRPAGLASHSANSRA